MRFHLVSLPHTQTTDEYLACAYTQKVVKFARMMQDTEHEVIIYSGEENDAPCDEHVPIVSHREQKRWFGKKNLDAMFPITWNALSEHWLVPNQRVVQHVKRGIRRGDYSQRDFVCIIAGTCHQFIDMRLDNLCPEYGVGYTGVFTHAAFESVSHRHTVYSLRGMRDGSWCDTVIPNYFDPREFEASKGVRRGHHLLYVGRAITRKGIHTAALVAQATGRDLLIAGQGVLNHRQGYIETDEFELEYPQMTYIGTLGVKERAYEMARAHAVLAPTQYLEPFGGVAVEAGFSGTPVLTTDWGAFTETVIPGVTGYRPRLLRDWVKAVDACSSLDRRVIRKSVTDRYSLDAVRPQFLEWFSALDTLHDEGWSAP